MTKIRVLIVDDHSLIRAGLKALLGGDPDMEVIGEASNGMEAVSRASELKPDVVLMDVSMPGKDGLEATTELRKILPEVKVLALTMHESEEYFFPMLQAGASGYVLKDTEAAELLSAIREVYQGNVYLSPLVSKFLLSGYLRASEKRHEEDKYAELTEREKEALRLAAQGKTNREMADELCLSVRTVEKHRASMMAKLQLRNRTELIKYALSRGLIEEDIDDE
ncbi:MAG: response regulator transcription factor [Chloroflexota bacterium]|nr:response regulator transcription factor [Chloroflexota bacterium]